MFQVHPSHSSHRSAPVPTERSLALVIDPDPSARAVLEVALARDGFDVWSVETAENGLAVLGRGRTPDVIVLETALKGGDGFSFCAELRGNPKTARVPILLLAAPGDQNVANLAEVVGVDDYVQKPAFARDVAALVRFELVRHKSTVGQPLRFHHRTVAASHLLRALLTSSRSGVFTLAGGAATVSFREGVIVQARCGAHEGVDALVRALALTTGDYSVALAPVSLSMGFQLSLRDFVALVQPRIARWTSLVQRSLPLDAVLAVDFNRLAQALPTMPDDVNRIVQLFDGRRVVSQVLLDSPFDHSLTLEVGTRLYLMGVIGPVKPEAEATAGKTAPKLFEPRSTEAEELMRQLFDGTAEVRADDVPDASADGADWTMVGAPSELDVEDPAGGWTTSSLPDAHLLDGLDSETTNRLTAFKTATVVEGRDAQPGAKAVTAFAKQGAVEVEGTSIDAALLAVTGEEPVIDDDPTPPSARRFTSEDRQERLVTPTLTPAVVAPVPLAEATHALTRDGVVVSTQPEPVIPAPAPAPAALHVAEIAAPRPAVVPLARINDEDTLDGGFFASAAPEGEVTGFEDTLPAHAEEPAKSKGRIGLLVGLGAAAVLLAIALEWMRQPHAELPAAPVAAALTAEPVAAPEPVVPAALEPVAEPAIEEAPVEEPSSIDVAEPLADGVRAYQQGQYQKAVAVLEQVVADDPKSIQGWLVLGQARYDAGQTQGAKDAAAKVIELDPKNGKVHLLLATIAHDLNDNATKRAEVEKYLELDPSGEHVAEAKALLSR